jgi:omega-amidase
MNALKVTTVQSSLLWESPEGNCTHFENLIAGITDGSDLVVLPEMFTTGFSMDSKRLAEPHHGATWQWMVSVSKKHTVAITGSLIIEDNGNYFNRLYFVTPNGESYHYDKKHLFRMANENNFFTAGEKRLIVNYKGWNICPMICYDLRFPIWSRNTKPEYDLLLYVANWPMPRANAWSALLTARAIENQCYVVGVNRVGEDGNGLPYSGNTALINPKGVALNQAEPQQEIVETTSLSLDELNEFREKFPVSMDADGFELVN